MLPPEFLLGAGRLCAVQSATRASNAEEYSGFPVVFHALKKPPHTSCRFSAYLAVMLVFECDGGSDGTDDHDDDGNLKMVLMTVEVVVQLFTFFEW